MTSSRRAESVIDTRRKRVAVVGAGPAGHAAATGQTDPGVQVDLYEASDIIGGLARSLTRWGRQLDLSARIFQSNDQYVTDLWTDHAADTLDLPR